jgi:mono/diheme cytochrome c family protein
MKNRIPILFVVVLFIQTLWFACSSRRSEPIRQKQFVAGTASEVNGEKKFMLFCYKCHPGGEAGLGPSISSNPAPQFVKRFQMRHGFGVMPSFTPEEISRSELRDISAYLKAWKNY